MGQLLERCHLPMFRQKQIGSQYLLKKLSQWLTTSQEKKTDLEEFADEILNFKEESIHLSANGNRREKQRKYLEMNSVPLP